MNNSFMLWEFKSLNDLILQPLGAKKSMMEKELRAENRIFEISVKNWTTLIFLPIFEKNQKQVQNILNSVFMEWRIRFKIF